MELTKEQFIEELADGSKEFNVASEDVGSLYLSLRGCIVDASPEDGEITMHKPYTDMEVKIDFDIVDTITKEDDNSYRLELHISMPDVIFTRL